MMRGNALGRTLPLLAVLLLFQPARVCSQNAGQESGHDHNDHTREAAGHGESDPLHIDADDIERMGIKIAPAGGSRIRQTLQLPGEIVLNTDRVSHIVPRFEGLVREVRKHLGDHVTQGEVVALIESNTSLQTYEVKSLIAGDIIEKHVALGEFVSTVEDIYVVADLSDVWVDISVYARDQGAVHVGQEVTLYSNDLDARVAGVISYVSPIVDERTRTSLARVVLANADKRWRPGSFVTAEIVLRETEVPMAVPNSAIETTQGHNVVFVETEGGFAPREITIGLADGSMSEITSGLQPGERIVVQGAFTLKAQLMKGSLGGEHGH